MARPKKNAEGAEASPPDFIDRIYDQVRADYGDNIMVSGEEAASVPCQKISWSPSIDLITDGGVLEGSWVGITGNEKTGKTSWALQLAAEAQKPEYGILQPDGTLKPRAVVYSKVEGRLAMNRLKEVAGLNLERNRFIIVQSQQGKILSAQDHLNILDRVIKTIPGVIVILDSISALCDEREMKGGVGTETRGGGAKIFSQWLREMGQVVPVNRSIVIGITHLISNTSGMGAAYMERAARAWKYQKDYDLRTFKKEKWKAGESVIGLKIGWKCETTPTGNPFLQNYGYLRFGLGVDRLFEAIQLGIDARLIRKAGAWYTLDFVGGDADPPKAQGGEGVYQLLLDNPEWAKTLCSLIEEMAADLAVSDGDE